jgi:uncharacterized protein
VSAENVETAKAAYKAFGSGDMETLAGTLAEDAEWLTSDELPLGGLVKGRDAIMGNFAQIPNYWSEFSVEPEEFIDGGDWVAVRGTQRASGESGGFESPFAHLLKYDAGGMCIRGEFYSDSAKAKQALGG